MKQKKKKVSIERYDIKITASRNRNLPCTELAIRKKQKNMNIIATIVDDSLKTM